MGHFAGELVTQTLPFEIRVPLLVGTSAQAIEYWPGPNDLRTWTWSQYAKYVTTSMDSFGPRMSQMALEKYPVKVEGEENEENEENEDAHLNSDTVRVNESDSYNSSSSRDATSTSTISINSNSNTTSFSPMKPEAEHSAEMMFASMVSDVRQTCPVNKMARSISSVSKSHLYRYIVTAQPSHSVSCLLLNCIKRAHLYRLISSYFFASFSPLLLLPPSKGSCLRL